MCRKMKSMRVFLNLLHYFYRRIQCNKIYNYVHGEAFEVKHETPILGVELNGWQLAKMKKSIPDMSLPWNW